MIVEGKYTNADIKTDDVEDYAIAQIKQLCDLECMKGNEIVCMPDIHPGFVSTIGFTCKVTNSKIMPALIGNDIGCGVTCVRLGTTKKLEWQKLDTVIRDNIPTGTKKRNKIHQYYDEHWLKESAPSMKADINLNKIAASMGTLGGGNHFIEIDMDDSGCYYITVHSGSRNLGNAVYEYWMDKAYNDCLKNGIDTPRELSYLSNEEDIYNYMTDIKNCIYFAHLNRMAIIHDITKVMKCKEIVNVWDCRHNYIEDLYNMGTYIIRKGAINAMYNKDIVIPINMRDGIIVGKGRSNERYNYSAPHGAGRISSRIDIKNTYTLKQYKESVGDVYSPTISKDTIDEAPFAYRSLDNIIPEISKIVDISYVLKPVYNYKGGSK